MTGYGVLYPGMRPLWGTYCSPTRHGIALERLRSATGIDFTVSADPGGRWNPGTFPHDGYSRLQVVGLLVIGDEVVTPTYPCLVSHENLFVQDGAVYVRSSFYVAVVEKDGIFDDGTFFYVDATG